ncbi:General transcription factor IIH subunit 5 [Phytophthora nicotianae]|uniref:General transcription and DNA repair factor IIH subunit TFB5 n=1 Tax=Phytophthora nicotianae TaxID=4792 RepID=A0A0W8CAN2_PHYNI|nr:General transcription factor IIH subunit 5 [Phytophthora nicotianae]
MPKRVSWEERATNVDAAAADAVLETLKTFDIDKSQTMACTICPEAEHKMRYRLLVCSCQACCEATTLECAWRGKIVTDPATKQYLLHLNETAVQQRFVIEDLDDTHLFIVPDPKVIAFIEKKMDEWNEKNTYQPPTQ